MIQIVKSSELEKDWFSGRTFTGTNEVVQSVIEDVIQNGDKALRLYGEKFDVSSPKDFLIPESELKAAAENLKKHSPDVYDAICYSHELAYKFALKQKDSFDDFEVELTPGMFTGQKTIPVEKAGVYVPAGRFPLVSTVVMTVTPAVAAGVKEIVLCTPPRVHPEDKAAAEKAGTGIPGKPFTGGKPYADEGIMAAAYICGVKKCYACGGSQAVAAMAYGTESIPAVDVIVGPGNKFVAAAKKMVFGNNRGNNRGPRRENNGASRPEQHSIIRPRPVGERAMRPISERTASNVDEFAESRPAKPQNNDKPRQQNNNRPNGDHNERGNRPNGDRNDRGNRGGFGGNRPNGDRNDRGNRGGDRNDRGNNRGRLDKEINRFNKESAVAAPDEVRGKESRSNDRRNNNNRRQEHDKLGGKRQG